MVPEARAAQLTWSLQRRSDARAPADWAAIARADPQTRVLLARGTSFWVRQEPRTEIQFLSPAQPPLPSLPDSQLALLGWFETRRCLLAELPPQLPFEPAEGRFEELRPLLPELREDEARLLSYARALLVWRARHRHCGVCGAPTQVQSAGHLLVCTSSTCGAEFFPRIDPAIIVLVTAGTKALLGRQTSWPPGRYSALAGFVEPGETLEEAVAREVEEETGVRIESAHYFASQPWPFPASLMLGFHATAIERAVQLDGELEDARWFERAELQATSGPLLPQPHTISRQLIDHWLQQPSRP
jgi:NADH pyrophosphatase NudC (nudix superfamily)